LVLMESLSSSTSCSPAGIERTDAGELAAGGGGPEAAVSCEEPLEVHRSARRTHVAAKPRFISRPHILYVKGMPVDTLLLHQPDTMPEECSFHVARDVARNFARQLRNGRFLQS
jgi:hypothetical protein